MLPMYKVIFVLTCLLVDQAYSANNDLIFQAIGFGAPLKGSAEQPWDPKFEDKNSQQYMDLSKQVCDYITDQFRGYIGAGVCPLVTFFEYNKSTGCNYNFIFQYNSTVGPFEFRKEILAVFDKMGEAPGVSFISADAMVVNVGEDVPSVNANPSMPSLEVVMQGLTTTQWTENLKNRTSQDYKTLNQNVCNSIKTSFKDLLFTDTCPTIIFWQNGTKAMFDAYIIYSNGIYAQSSSYGSLQNYAAQLQIKLEDNPSFQDALPTLIWSQGPTTKSASTIWNKDVIVLISSMVLIQMMVWFKNMNLA